MSIKKTKIWRLFSSIKLAIWLLAIIAVFSLVGTFIPQNQAAAFYMDKFGHAAYSIISRTGLTDVYCSWWFILPIVIFSLNLAICLLNRLPFKSRSAGTIISHLGVLVILLGALIGAVYGQKALIKINKREEVGSFTSKNCKVDLGFSIKLDDFIYNENIDSKEKLLIYAIKDTDQAPIAEVSTEIGSSLEIGDTGYKIKVIRYVSDFIMDMSTKMVMTRSAAPNNPAIEVELKDKEGSVKRLWIFARFPDMHEKGDIDFKFIYKWSSRRPKDFISKVTILKDGREIMRRDILVNEPLSYGGYTFFQSTYDVEGLSWSGLQVVRDPGVGVVYAGFALLIAGFIMIFYVNPLIERR